MCAGEVADQTWDGQKRYFSLKQTYLLRFDTTFQHVFLGSREARELGPKAEETVQKHPECGMLGPDLADEEFYSSAGAAMVRLLLKAFVDARFPLDIQEDTQTQHIVKRLKLVRLQEELTWGSDFLTHLKGHEKTPVIEKITEKLRQKFMLLGKDPGNVEEGATDEKAKQREIVKARQAAILASMRERQRLYVIPDDEQENKEE